MFSTTSVTVCTTSKAKMQEIIHFSGKTTKENWDIKGFVTQTEHNLVTNNPAAEKARFASTDVGAMLSKALKSSHLVGIFLVASNKFISCLMTS